jgi:HlyD family secretion protein
MAQPDMPQPTPPEPKAEHALRVVESMTSGVVTLDAEGRVTAINRRAAQIVGRETAELMGESLIAILLEDPSNEQFSDAIVEASYDASGRYHRQVEWHSGGRTRTLDLRANLLRGAGGAVDGVILVIDDVTETALLRASELRLTEELRTRNDSLTEAYRGLEDRTRSLQQARRRLRVFGAAALGTAVLVVGGAAFYAWTATAPPGRPRTAAAGQAPGGTPGFVAAARPLRQTTNVSGVIEPGQVVEITAPFAGQVLARDFVYGSKVEQGQELLRLDGAEIERERRKSQVATMAARQKLAELVDWEIGNDVQRARRQVAQARQNLERLQQQVQTAGDLLRRGIIARQEQDSLQQQLRQQELQVFSSEQDLAATLRKGSPDQVTAARLELASTEEKLQDQMRQLAAAHILAPVSGVALRPRAPSTAGGDGAGSRDVTVGGRVDQGRTLLEIGDLTTLAIRSQVDEVDVARVRPGLPVTVRGAGFGNQPLAGEVTAVSSQANADRAGGRAPRPRFDVVVTIRNLPEPVRQNLRIGMSATVEIVIYENPTAILVPQDLIQRGPAGLRLRVRKGGTGEPQDVEVRLGVSLPQGVEVLAGLSPGDEVLPRQQ